jgi:hypothetical protein
MKFKLIIILFIISISQAFGCDVCGCGNGASFFGILPQSHFRFGGVRFTSKNFESHISSKNLKATEHFQTIEPWIRLYPLPKTQLIVTTPYHFNSQTLLYNMSKKSISGIGDVNALMHYNILNTFFDSTSHTFDHVLLLGGGIKLPTGVYDYSQDASTVSNANFQKGTGSVDYVLNAIYTIRKGTNGLNLDLYYKINGENKNKFRFGNKSRILASAFKQITIKDLSFMPNLGALAEYSKSDFKNKEAISLSGGYTLNGVLGSEVYYKRIVAGVNYQVPISQKLSDGELKLKNTFSGHLTFLF